MISLALFQPDNPRNTGTVIRLGACLGVAVHIIEPCGFPFSTQVTPKALKAGLLDYLDAAEIHHHRDWAAFHAAVAGRRLVLMTTRAHLSYTDFRYRRGDILLLGQESAGVPDNVADAADARLKIPMRSGLRSINVALAAAMVTGEALRQTDGLPRTD